MNESLGKDYWNSRYREENTGWDLGRISKPLEEYFSQLKNKDTRILIPGAGNAWEAEYLVDNGFRNVFVCDIAETALANLKKRCPAFKSENLFQSDFFALRNITFDLIAEQTFFCALDPSLRRKYFEKVHELLVMGGKLCGLLFDCGFEKEGPPFGGSADEYRRYFSGLFRIVVFSPCYNSIEPRAGREIFMILEKK